MPPARKASTISSTARTPTTWATTARACRRQATVVSSPLVDADFAKPDIRALAAETRLGKRPRAPSRLPLQPLPYGSHITEARLAQVEAAENALADLGFGQFRVRHHEEVARIELTPAELPKALELRMDIEQRLKAAGYHYVAVDLGGFRSGSLNEGLIDVVQVYDVRGAAGSSQAGAV